MLRRFLEESTEYAESSLGDIGFSPDYSSPTGDEIGLQQRSTQTLPVAGMSQSGIPHSFIADPASLQHFAQEESKRSSRPARANDLTTLIHSTRPNLGFIELADTSVTQKQIYGLKYPRTTRNMLYAIGVVIEEHVLGHQRRTVVESPIDWFFRVVHKLRMQYLTSRALTVLTRIRTLVPRSVLSTLFLSARANMLSSSVFTSPPMLAHWLNLKTKVSQRGPTFSISPNILVSTGG